MNLKMRKVSGLTGPMFIISCFLLFLVFCTAKRRSHDVGSIKKAFVEEIVRKVCNLSLDTLSNKSPEDKAKLLINIEEKLKKSAESLGDHGEKYIKIIMKGVRLKAFGKGVAKVDENKNSNIHTDKFESSDVKKTNLTNILRLGTETNTQQMSLANEFKSKDELINNIASKIKSLAKTYLNEATTPEGRRKAIENIKNKFEESVRRKHTMLHSKHDDFKTYVDLVAKGIEIMMRKNAEKEQTRRMEFALTENVKIQEDSRDDNLEYHEPIKGDGFLNELGHGGYLSPKSLQSVVFRINEPNDAKLTSSCYDAVEETCNKIKLVKTFHCQTDNTVLNIMKLCDGVGDCLDFSDEQQCAKQAIESIESANRLMTYIDTSMSRHCYPDNMMDGNLVAKQNEVLGEVLKNQLNFLHAHALDGTSIHSRRVFSKDIQSIKKTINEAVSAVDTLSSALEGSLCSNLVKVKARDMDFGDSEKEHTEKDTMFKKKAWTPEVCKCNGQKCNRTCSPECERICVEKYSLSQWTCPAISGEKIVSLDMICDGKVDCYDESDEQDCSGVFGFSKFEATQMYNQILQTLKTKASSVTLDKIRNRLNNMHELVQKLQKVSMNLQTDIVEVKRIRKLCFVELSAIYDNSLRYIRSPQEAVEMYSFLVVLNERLVSALKRSHMGNDKIIAADGCVCRFYHCAMPRCTKPCTRACLAEPRLTRYFCGGSLELNSSIPVELICNGKKNCPEGDDEKDCKTEICRRHHLVVLRHNLRDVGKSMEATNLGEILKLWNNKVKASILIAEKGARPTPYVLREFVNDVLHDLVMTYATVEKNPRIDPDTVYKEFYKWSRVVLDTLKSCAN